MQDLIGGGAVLDLATDNKIMADTPAEAMTLAVAATGRAADRFLAEVGRRIAFALATVVGVLDPSLVVLAGEVAQAGGTRLRDAVAAAMHSSAPSRSRTTRTCRSRRPRSSTTRCCSAGSTPA
jgi:predicted NBD/HSP70 family sugar kinase